MIAHDSQLHGFQLEAGDSWPWSQLWGEGQCRKWPHVRDPMGGTPKNVHHRQISMEPDKQKEGRKATLNSMCTDTVLLEHLVVLILEGTTMKMCLETSVNRWPSAWCHSGGSKNPQFLYNFPVMSIP